MNSAELTVIETTPQPEKQHGALATMRDFNDIARMANAIGKSGFFGIQNANQALALMMLAEAEGLHPARAFQEYHVIQGKPSLRSDAMLARYQRAGGKVQYTKRTEDCVEMVFDHPASSAVTVKWDMKRANKIKVWKNKKEVPLTSSATWKNYPTAMLTARCISEGVRASYPACIVGFYAPEEVEGFGDPEPDKLPPADPEPTKKPAAKKQPAKKPAAKKPATKKKAPAKREKGDEARDLYKALVNEMRQTRSEAEHIAWYGGAKDRIDDLPRGWQSNFTNDINDHLENIRTGAYENEETEAETEPGADIDAEFDEIEEDKSRPGFTPTEEEPFDDEIPF